MFIADLSFVSLDFQKWFYFFFSRLRYQISRILKVEFTSIYFDAIRSLSIFSVDIPINRRKSNSLSLFSRLRDNILVFRWRVMNFIVWCGFTNFITAFRTTVWCRSAFFSVGSTEKKHYDIILYQQTIYTNPNRCSIVNWYSPSYFPL